MSAGDVAVTAPFAGTVARLLVAEGDVVRDGSVVAILESMKMEYEIIGTPGGVVTSLPLGTGDAVAAGQTLMVLAPGLHDTDEAATPVDAKPVAATGAVRPELAELQARQAKTTDAERPEVVARRHAASRRTVRENLEDLLDPGSLSEYGSLVIAAQRARRSVDELIDRTPADGLIAGFGRIDGVPCAVLAYDYTVLAGTQGQMNHRKKDRLLAQVARLGLPVVLFAEGGGGRPGDTDHAVVTGLDTEAFALFARLSGSVPLVGVVSGRCFAGNAALLGCCDVIIATPDANIGMGGPAMIEGGGLGVVTPEAVGPVSVQVPNGVIDVLAPDEAAAVDLARQYLGYFTRPATSWTCADQILLRDVVPPDRRRAYDVHAAVTGLADTGSVLELRPQFAPGMLTALVRLEGRPVGVIANNPMHLAGAIDADNADKAARFMQLCQAHHLPVLFLCDTPGFMVGPEAEQTALVRHVSRMFVTGASLTVPFCTVILRKGYGLGAQAMAGGSFHQPICTVAWPTGELGGMGLEGAVRLGFRRELEAIADPAQREEAFTAMVQRAYEHGKALNVAMHFEIDDVIDPADTRARVVQAFRAAEAGGPGADRPTGRPFVDTW